MSSHREERHSHHSDGMPSRRERPDTGEDKTAQTLSMHDSIDIETALVHCRQGKNSEGRRIEVKDTLRTEIATDGTRVGPPCAVSKVLRKGRRRVRVPGPSAARGGAYGRMRKQLKGRAVEKNWTGRRRERKAQRRSAEKGVLGSCEQDCGHGQVLWHWGTRSVQRTKRDANKNRGLVEVRPCS
ncbi:hypothetical protein TRVL_01826 [Trypanosoma vivax]|nr:hypothetical protein TRVL_01826 [Trypanosoma vivax]